MKRFKRLVVALRPLLPSRRPFSTGSPGTRPPTLEATLEAKEYWRRLYRSGEDVFTLDGTNENLLRHWSSVTSRFPVDYAPSSDALPRVLVPMCGRDISLAWIAQQGYGAVGVDFVDEPLRQLGNEVGGLHPLVDDHDVQGSGGGAGVRMAAYRAARRENLILIHADFMTLQAERDLGGKFEAVWDRAACTTVRAADKDAYVQQLAAMLVPGGVLLLEALTCNLDLHGAVAAGETEALLRRHGFSVSVLSDVDKRGEYSSFSPPGLKYLREIVLAATRA
jgi:hypothetical protein